MGVATMQVLEARFFAALEDGNSAAIAECYAPDIRIWNNLHRVEIGGAEHIAGLEAHVFNHVLNRKYIEPRTDLIDGGFVRQHVLTGSVDGVPINIPMCLICRVLNDRLIRIDEYLTPPPAS